MAEEKKTVREQLAEQFVAAIKEDPIHWNQSFTSVRNNPCNGVSGREYKNINRMILTMHMSMNGYADPRFYSQSYIFSSPENRSKEWDDPEKIKVKKGEKSVLIDTNFYVPKNEKTLEKLKLSDEIRNEIKEGLKPISMAQFYKLDSDHKVLYRILTKPVPVFNAEQLEGVPPMKDIELNNDIVRDGRAEEAVNNAIKSMNVGYEENSSVSTPCYRPLEDKIFMPTFEQFKNEYEYYGTKLHEIAHATGSSERLGRDLSGTFGSESYAIEELRAEISSCFIANDCGIPMPESSMENHKAYVQSWAEAIAKDERILTSAIFDAQEIADYVIEKTGLDLSKELDTEKTKSPDPAISDKKKVSEPLDFSGTEDRREYVPRLSEWEKVLEDKLDSSGGFIGVDVRYNFRGYTIFHEEEVYGNDTHGWNAAYRGENGNDYQYVAGKCLSKEEALDRVISFEEENCNLQPKVPEFEIHNQRQTKCNGWNGKEMSKEPRLDK